MKIGFSYSRCLVDLYTGKVDYDDVLVIIARTKFDPTNPEHWKGIWEGYTSYNPFCNPVWVGYEDKEEEFKKLTLQLYKDAKLHQPRMFGVNPYPMRANWMEVASEWMLATEEERAKRNKELIANDNF